MAHVLHLGAPVTPPQYYYCQNPIEGGTICGFRWTLDVPPAGKVDYQLACLRCGHAYEVTVTAPKPPRPPKTRCRHNRGAGYTDQRGRLRCSACGVVMTKQSKASATKGQPHGHTKRP